MSTPLDPPNVECAVVSAVDGSINLTWTAPADPLNEFTAYNIYEINPGTLNAVLVSTVTNYNNTTLTVPGYDGTIQPYCFYVETESFDGTVQFSDPSETLCTIYLQATTGLQPGTVDLAWNFPFPFVDQDAMGAEFLIYRQYLGAWSIIDQFPAVIGSLGYTYTVDVCQADLNFQIRYNYGALCDIYSNVSGGIFQDQTNPSPPDINGITVDSLTNQAIVSWNPPPEGDVSGYILYECFAGLNPMPVDTIYNAAITTWTNPSSQANLGPESYNIAAFDSCFNNLGEPDPGAGSLDCSQSIYLTHVWESCSDEVTLGWTPADYWDNGVAFYEIFAQEEPVPGSGVFEPSFVLDIVDGSTNTYLHTGATLGSSYRYRVKAHSSDLQYTAASNNRTATLAYPTSPQFTYTTAYVESREEIMITAVVDPGFGSAHTFLLQKQNEFDPEFQTIDSQTVAGVSTLQFSDQDVDPTEKSYTYRIQVENNCGDVVYTSNIGETMLLTGIANTEQLTNTIIWNGYEEWDEGVDYYQIFRKIDGAEFPVFLDEVPGSVTFYEDDVSQLFNTKGEFCYLIAAFESPNGITLPAGSLSNEHCLTQDPVIWIPNAFVVDGFNKIFKPVISFADTDNYRMEIYSRWGNIVFTTTDVTEGWDGIYKDELVPEGLYAYYISVADGAGRIIENRGTLTLLKAAID